MQCYAMLSKTYLSKSTGVLSAKCILSLSDNCSAVKSTVFPFKKGWKEKTQATYKYLKFVCTTYVNVLSSAVNIFPSLHTTSCKPQNWSKTSTK